jgi:hypothetical protein
MRSFPLLPIFAFGGALAALTALATSSAVAQPMQSVPCDDTASMHSWDQPATVGGNVEIGARVFLRKKLALMALREEGRRLQEDDGGRLTDSHRDYLQAKLDAIQSGNY